MILVYGKKIVHSSVGNGTFYCLSCGSKTSYQLIERQRVFTLWFIAVLPLEDLGRAVRCDSCSLLYEESVLEARNAGNVDKIRKDLREALRRIIIAVAQAGGSEPEAIAIYRAQYERLFAQSLTWSEAEWDLCSENLSANDILGTLVGSLDTPVRALIMDAAVSAALPRPTPDQNVILESLSSLLNVPRHPGRTLVTRME